MEQRKERGEGREGEGREREREREAVWGSKHKRVKQLV